MSIQIKRSLPNARVPSSCGNGSYDLFSAECQTIKPGNSVNISTGFMISLPIGYYGLIESVELSTQRGVETSSFAGIHFHSFKKSVKYTRHEAELVITLRNFGMSSFVVQPGDIIGRLVLVRTGLLDVREVTEFEDEIVRKPVAVASAVAALAKDPETWFRLRWKESPDEMMLKYFNPVLIDSIFTFRQSLPEDAPKDSIELNFVWSCLTAEKRSEVNQDYEDYKRAYYGNHPEKAPTSQKPPDQKPSKKGRKKKQDPPKRKEKVSKAKVSKEEESEEETEEY